MRVIYLFGAPGSGKTTLMREMMKPFPATQHAKPFAHLSYEHPSERVAQLGKDRGTFSGTDALSMGVQPKVVEWLRECEFDTILGEGDRLANEKFFTDCRAIGNLTLVYVSTPAAMAAARRAERAAELGVAQNETWVKGRITKSERIAESNGHITIPGDQQRMGEVLADLLWGPGYQ